MISGGMMALALAVGTAAQQDGAASISLFSFSISPGEVHLKAGQRVVLRIANDSAMGHDLSAPEFFAAAAVGPEATAGGKISLAAHESVAVTIVPKAGRYTMKCSHAFHKMLGMSGMIVVDP